MMRSDAERLALIRGFALGLRVAQHAHDIEPGGKAEYQVLSEIAKGQLTLQASPNELQQRLPGLPAEIADRYEQRMRVNQEAERRDAILILGSLPKP